MQQRPHTLILVGRLILCVVVATASGIFLLYLFAFSSMNGIDPNDSARWWGAALRKLYLRSDPGIASWPASALLLASGFFFVRYSVALIRRAVWRSTGGARDTAADSTE